MLAVHPGQLLGGIGEERHAPVAALLGVALHARGVVRAHHDQIQPAEPVRDGPSSISRASLIAPG